jgi:hypothetical protein
VRQVFVANPGETLQRRFHVVSTGEAIRLEHMRQTPIEALQHLIGLWILQLGEPLLSPQHQAQLIELMLAADILVSLPKGRVSELSALICQQGLPLERRDHMQANAPMPQSSCS